MAPSKGWFFSELVDIDEGGGGLAPLEIRDTSILNAGSVSSASITTPALTSEGDLLLCLVVIHTPIANYRCYSDDGTWEQLDHIIEDDAGKDHQQTLFWKRADSDDALGGASHQFNNRNSKDTADVTDNTDIVIVAISGAQEVGTGLDFLYAWENVQVNGANTDVLLGDLDFDEAPDGNGMLLTFLTNDLASTTITTPAEMTEDVNDAGGGHTIVVASEIIVAQSGSLGPKRFIQSTAADYIATTMIIRPDNGGYLTPKYTYPKLRGRRISEGIAGSVSRVISPPAETVEGDLLLVCLGRAGSTGESGFASPVVDPVSQGWTRLYDSNISADQALGIWWKFADADDASTAPDELRFEWESSKLSLAVMYAFSGVSHDTAEDFIGFLGARSSAGTTLAQEPNVVTPFDDCLLFKLFIGDGGGSRRRSDLAPRGAGSMLENLKGQSSSGVVMYAMIEGAPFAGPYGGSTIFQDTSEEYEWITIYICPNPTPPDLSSTIGIRSPVSTAVTELANLILRTPRSAEVGDLLIATFITDSGNSNWEMYPDDLTAGWSLLDHMEEINASSLHQYSIWWKLYDGDFDVQFNSRDALNTTNHSDQSVHGTMMAIANAQEPATDLDFLYAWDFSEVSGDGDTDILLANDLEYQEAPDGDGLLVCILAYRSQLASDEIIVPPEMDVVLGPGEGGQFGGDGLLQTVITSEVVAPTTGGVGPKRFIVSDTAIDYMGISFIVKPFNTGGRSHAIYSYPKIRDYPNRTAFEFSAQDRIVVDIPGNVEENDLLVMIAHRQGGGVFDGLFAPDESPADQGWTILYSEEHFTAVATGIWWKRATADDASTQPDQVILDWNSIGVENGVVYVYRFAGVEDNTGGDFIGLLGATVSSNNPLAEPSVITPFNNCLIIKAVVMEVISNSLRYDMKQRNNSKIIDRSMGTNLTSIIMVEGAPVAGSYGGGEIEGGLISSNEWEWVEFYIALSGGELDVDFASVQLLLHFEGVEDQTTASDNSGNDHTITFISDAKILHEERRFGGSSLRVSSTTDAISAPDHAGFEMGTGDFTIEGSFKWIADSGSQLLMGKWDTGESQKSYGVFYDAVGNTLEVFFSTDGSTSLNDIVSTTFIPTLGQWYEIALDFDGTTYRLYIDGAVVGSSTTLRTLFSGTSLFYVGADGLLGDDEFNGYVDEVRVTKGVARYAGAYTPASIPFPNSA